MSASPLNFTLIPCARELAVRKSETGDSNPDMSDIMDGLQRKARDHARNPMQWDDSPNAGFSLRGDAKPWMRVHDDHREWNVAKQIGDPDSVLSFWKRMLGFRKGHLSCVSPVLSMYWGGLG